MVKPIIKLRASGTQFSYPTNENSLLDALKLHKIPVEYQCCSGYCGACRLKLLKGEVAYHQLPLAFIDTGEILPCCCTPLVDIELEI